MPNNRPFFHIVSNNKGLKFWGILLSLFLSSIVCHAYRIQISGEGSNFAYASRNCMENGKYAAGSRGFAVVKSTHQKRKDGSVVVYKVIEIKETPRKWKK